MPRGLVRKALRAKNTSMRKPPIAGFVFLGALIIGLLASGCSTRAATSGSSVSAAASQPSTVALAAPRAMPTGSYGALVRYGRDIIEHTPQLMPANVGAGMSCEACHIAAGTKPYAAPFVGIYAEFPQWSARAKRFISIQDRIAECFLYSLNGRPPAYTSREMEALTAYIAWLSTGQPVGTKVAGSALERVTPPHPADPRAGAVVFAQRCETCHGADGAGRGGAFPPLWGAKSFNASAGMSRLPGMAGFIRYNMPYGSPPNTLTAQQAYDVAAFVLSHQRPHFQGNRSIAFPAHPAKFF
jgi:thiosulfate dehydrogenase